MAAARGGLDRRGRSERIAGTTLPALGAALAACGCREEAAAVLDTACAVAQHLNLPGALAQHTAHRPTWQRWVRTLTGWCVPSNFAMQRWPFTVSTGCVPFSLTTSKPLPATVRHCVPPSTTSGSCTRRKHCGPAWVCARTPYQQEAFDATDRRLREAVGSTAFREAASTGTGLTLDAAVACVRRARGTRGRPASGWLSLTPTELDVVRLVAVGLTNPQIAARLFIGRGTVRPTCRTSTPSSTRLIAPNSQPRRRAEVCRLSGSVAHAGCDRRRPDDHHGMGPSRSVRSRSGRRDPAAPGGRSSRPSPSSPRSTPERGRGRRCGWWSSAARRSTSGCSAPGSPGIRRRGAAW